MTPKEIREWRHTHNFSPADLAQALEVSRNTIYRWETGAMEPMGNLAERLTTVLANRAAEELAVPQYKFNGDNLVMESRVEHGTPVGLYRDFWQNKTDAERVAYIMATPNPLLALPWPYWSLGWSFWPPRGKAKPTREDHFLVDWVPGVLEKLMQQDFGPADQRLRNAVVHIMRRDAPDWFTATGTKAMDSDMRARLQKIMDGS